MRQRVVIALALAAEPKLIVADEPTTALDVSIQAQIITLLKNICKSRGAAVMLITHDMGVVAEMADRVVVMYGGRVVEEGDVVEIFKKPKHPYTLGLLNSIPRVDYGVQEDHERRRLEAIPGNVPSPLNLPPGCAFTPRCKFAQEACSAAVPPLVDTGNGHMSRCIRWKEL